MNRRTLLTFLIATLFAAPVISLAASGALQFSPPCVSVPGFPACAGPITATTPINVYLVRIYQFAMGISGITAVAMIIWGAIYISVYTERIDRKEEGREMILAAFEGIALLFGSYLLLRTINPEIVKLKEPVAPTGAIEQLVASATSSAPSACGTFTSIAPDGIGATAPDAAGGCGYKRLRLTKEQSLSADRFYSSSVTLPADTIVWMWPYYASSSGAASAQCLVYAYKKPPYQQGQYCDPMGACVPSGNIITPSTEMMPLNLDKLQKCPAGTPPQQDGAPLSLDAAAALAQLNAHHVTLSSSGNCSTQTNSSCTSLEGMPQNAIDFLSGLGDWCTTNGCSVTVTGGTEVGHKTHGPGKAIFDLRSTGTGAAALGQHLYDSTAVTTICTMAVDPDKKYRKNCSTFDETAQHFHVQL